MVSPQNKTTALSNSDPSWISESLFSLIMGKVVYSGLPLHARYKWGNNLVILI